MSVPKHKDDCPFSIGRGFTRLSDHPAGWTYGTVFSPYGTVTVYAQGDKTNHHYTELNMLTLYNGKVNRRVFRRRLNHLAITRAAMRFARDLEQ